MTMLILPYYQSHFGITDLTHVHQTGAVITWVLPQSLTSTEFFNLV